MLMIGGNTSSFSRRAGSAAASAAASAGVTVTIKMGHYQCDAILIQHHQIMALEPPYDTTRSEN